MGALPSTVDAQDIHTQCNGTSDQLTCNIGIQANVPKRSTTIRSLLAGILF